MDDVDGSVAERDRFRRAGEHGCVGDAEPHAALHRQQARPVVRLDHVDMPGNRREAGDVVPGPGAEVQDVAADPVRDGAHRGLDPVCRVYRPVLDLVALGVDLDIGRFVDAGQPVA